MYAPSARICICVVRRQSSVKVRRAVITHYEGVLCQPICMDASWNNTVDVRVPYILLSMRSLQ